MTIDQLCKHKSMLCTSCGAKSSATVTRLINKWEAMVRCVCGKEWYASVPIYQQEDHDRSEARSGEGSVASSPGG